MNNKIACSLLLGNTHKLQPIMQVLSHADFEKHGFELFHDTGSWNVYKKDLPGMEGKEAMIVYKYIDKTIDLILLHKNPSHTTGYGNYYFRDVMIKDKLDLDFMLERCYMYRLIHSQLADNLDKNVNTSPLNFSNSLSLSVCK